MKGRRRHDIVSEGAAAAVAGELRRTVVAGKVRRTAVAGEVWRTTADTRGASTRRPHKGKGEGVSHLNLDIRTRSGWTAHRASTKYN
ncbi:hypothetical protein Scep_029643 [Stephania cephalantha]|uniref:Uncharacterized protein n=1 Tax=Stephania cephalantha TaxID=152367 RepID=A0AAP0HFT7_9MAGN